MRWIFKTFCVILFAFFINSALALENADYEINGWPMYKTRVFALTQRIADVVDALILNTNDSAEKQQLFVEYAQAITNIITTLNKIIILKNRGDMEF